MTSPLATYAWPGGYPIIYIDVSGPEDIGQHGDVLCAECAWHAIVRDDTPMARDCYMEGPDEYCADCGVAIPSAYGDPDAPEEDES
jgi:hypothetical protein